LFAHDHDARSGAIIQFLAADAMGPSSL
jgi:hypothetical protein